MQTFNLFFSGSERLLPPLPPQYTYKTECKMLVNKKADMLTGSHVKMIYYIILVVHTHSVIIIGHPLLKIDIVVFYVCAEARYQARHLTTASIL